MSENHDPTVAEGPTPEAAECPVLPGRVHPTAGDANSEWWPRRLNLKILAKNPVESNPMGEDFDYAAAFNSLDLAAVKRDIAESCSAMSSGNRNIRQPLRKRRRHSSGSSPAIRSMPAASGAKLLPMKAGS